MIFEQIAAERGFRGDIQMPQADDAHTDPSVKTYVTLSFDRAFTDSDLEDLEHSTSASRAMRLPPAVKAAYDLANERGFMKSSRPEIGLMLSVLAAAVPRRGRVLEIGTGAGVGLAWIVSGLGQRDDVEVVSVEVDPDLAERVRAIGWPDWVSIITGDSAKLLQSLGSFDLIFPDSPDEKTFGVRPSIAALRPGGILLLDDMEVSKEHGPERRVRLAEARRGFLEDPEIVFADLPLSSGVLLASRRRP